MKTTLEIPDPIFRKAKSKAAQQGIPLRQFVTEAVEDKLKTAHAVGQKPWMKHMGKLKDLHKETVRINKVIEEAFEEVDRRCGPWRHEIDLRHKCSICSRSGTSRCHGGLG